MIWDKKKIQDAGIEGNWVMGLHDFVRYSDLDTYAVSYTHLRAHET